MTSALEFQLLKSPISDAAWEGKISQTICKIKTVIRIYSMDKTDVTTTGPYSTFIHEVLHEFQSMILFFSGMKSCI